MPPVSQQLKPAPHSQQCCQFVRRDLDAAHKMTARVLVGLQTVVRTWMGAAAALEADLQPMVSSGLIHKSSGPKLQSGGTYGLSGRWRKDRTSSDDMGAACDAVCLPWLLRKALRILNVLEVSRLLQQAERSSSASSNAISPTGQMVTWTWLNRVKTTKCKQKA